MEEGDFEREGRGVKWLKELTGHGHGVTEGVNARCRDCSVEEMVSAVGCNRDEGVSRGYGDGRCFSGM